MSTRILLLILSSFVFLMSVNSQANDLDSDFSDLIEEAVVGGSPASAAEQANLATVSLVITKSNRVSFPTWETCSGTMISKDLVLTAAHCLMPTASQQSVETIYVSLGNKRVKATQWIQHPEFRGDYENIGFLFTRQKVYRAYHDIALVRLEKPISSVTAKLPANEVSVGVSQKVMISGYGTNSPDNPSDNNPLRIGFSMATLISNNGDYQYELTGAQICKGDSGGPILVKVNGSLTVIGVHSYGNDLNPCREKGRSMSVYSNLNWIRKTIKKLMNDRSI